MSRVLIQDGRRGGRLREDPGLTPRDCNGEKVIRCKDCPKVQYERHDQTIKEEIPYCSISGAHGRYIIKHYWEHNRIASFCKLKDYKELPKTRDRFKNLILEENDNASDTEGT